MHLRAFDIYSEPYGSTGNIGENLRKLLGAPSLDILHTVVRESVQNIADAAKLGVGPEILIRIRELSAEQTSALRSVVFARYPQHSVSIEGLQRFLDNPKPVVMEICDFGTSGLGGPTRADRIPEDCRATDFIDFLRNVGTPRDTVHGGGTYGFGKVALYRASRCGSILVDSLVADDEGSGERRLIGCHLGPSFEVKDQGFRRRFTGRHWWGYASPQDCIVDPALNEDAVQIANLLGLPSRCNGRTGTSIMILDFDLEGDSIRAAGNKVVEALLWNFWPRMLEGTHPSKRFMCTVEINGEILEIPRPEEFSPFDLFAKAMKAVRTGNGGEVLSIDSERPKKHLGKLAITKGIKAARFPLVSDGVIPPVLRHIALMRPVELVVKYLEGMPLPDERLEWCGVFVVDDSNDVERAFADAEPPAHDDWVPDSLSRPSRTYVSVALQRLKAKALEMGTLARGGPSFSESTPPLARLATKLGNTLDSVNGYGVSKRRARSPAVPERAGRRPTTATEFVRLVFEAGEPRAVFSVELVNVGEEVEGLIFVYPLVVIDGSPCREVEKFERFPEVREIRTVEGAVLPHNNGKVLASGIGEKIFVSVSLPGSCAVSIGVELKSGGAV